MWGSECIHACDERRRSERQQSEEELGVRLSMERHNQVGKGTQQGEEEHAATACKGGPVARSDSRQGFPEQEETSERISQEHNP